MAKHRIKRVSLIGKRLKTPGFLLAKGDPRGHIPPHSVVEVVDETHYKSKRFKDAFGEWQTIEPEQRVMVKHDGNNYWIDPYFTTEVD